MRVPILAILALILASLACGTYVTPTPTPVPAIVQPSPIPTATPVFTPTAESVNTEIHVDTATIRATVYVRQLPDATSPEVGSLETGQSVEIVECVGEWCEIVEPAGFVWRGCTDNNPDNLKCEAAR